MKKQLVSTLVLIVCVMFAEATAMAQGIIVHKKNGEEIILPYSAIDSIETYTADVEVIDGHECVDLGLSVKWATCNVGAYSPEEYGGYYAWGETEEKSVYTWDTYKWCKGIKESITKYQTNPFYGGYDNKNTLDPEDDIAHVKWGGNWRMPTQNEFDELVKKCTWTWTKQNEVKGMKIVGPNGNHIFLPAAGDRNFFGIGGAGCYWSANLVGIDSNTAVYCLLFDAGDYQEFRFGRSSGLTVRPVIEY